MLWVISMAGLFSKTQDVSTTTCLASAVMTCVSDILRTMLGLLWAPMRPYQLQGAKSVHGRLIAKTGPHSATQECTDLILREDMISVSC